MDDMPAQPVKSAKDAINAMYASDPSRRLSSYLASSAEQISTRRSAAKSASSLHQSNSDHRSRLEFAHPSPSTMLRKASSDSSSSEQVVVRTSLKLEPKKPARTIAHAEDSAPLPDPSSLIPESPAAESASRLNAAMQAIKSAASSAVEENKEKTKPSVVDQIPVKAEKKTEKKPPASNQPAITVKPAKKKPLPRSAMPHMARTSAGTFQDVIRPAKGMPSLSRPTIAKDPSIDTLAAASEATAAMSPAVKKTPAEPGKAKAKPAIPHAIKTVKPDRPLDSIKNRFRPAPKGYAAGTPNAARPNRPVEVEAFFSPTFSRRALVESEDSSAPSSSAKTPAPAANSAPVESPTTRHIYGMQDGPEEFTGLPGWSRSAPKDDFSSSPNTNGLGVVEDYHPGSIPMADVATHIADPTPVSKLASPDNNRYALGARSPYFLESSEMDKRPIVAPGSRLRGEPSVYAAQSLEEKPSKNLYEKKKKSTKDAKPKAKTSKTTKSAKSTKSTKSAPRSRRERIVEAPTVIIPSARRSHAPIVALLIVTVILGAIVGGLAYLFFYQ